MPLVARVTRILAVACILAVGAVAIASAYKFGDITGVRLSPDLKHIVIECDGPVGDYEAFVIGQPYRLVIDFEGTGLGRFKRVMKVARKPIDEIRTGSSGSKSRVVVDFGSIPVPPYKIHRENNRVLVVLGRASGGSPVVTGRRKPARQRHARKRPGPPEVRRASPSSSDDASFRLRSSSVSGDTVVLELLDAKNKDKACRIELKMDVDAMKLIEATLSNADGKSETVKLAETVGAPDAAATEEPPKVGPRRDEKSPEPPDAAGPKSRYKWGSLGIKEADAKRTMRKGKLPLKLEEISLKKRSRSEEGS